jgi:hypothetical protein
MPWRDCLRVAQAASKLPLPARTMQAREVGNRRCMAAVQGARGVARSNKLFGKAYRRAGPAVE